ncbi:phosphate ABC transporter permease PstA [Methylohalobius crimeensis]|uniref:phosphate ABC transporter permease PstA n=1 Tax=Methylohalobius crimeensis TaxID=244365 RepID=UPI0003B4B7AA|nr:phosphate ABC transporter permease PstA [Methylohalobius crimeensis]
MNNQPSSSPADRLARTLGRRRARETRLKIYGILAVATGLVLLTVLLSSILLLGYRAFQQTYIALDIHFDPQVIAPDGRLDLDSLRGADYSALIRRALQDKFPEVTGRRSKRSLYRLLSVGAPNQLRKMVLADSHLIGTTRTVWLIAHSDVDMYMKGYFEQNGPSQQGRLKDAQTGWIEQLAAEDRLEKRFNWVFFTSGDSREPELAGILGALMGSIYAIGLTLALSFPLGVAAAVYLEEFAPKKNFWVDLIEVNINNLAAVPSIVFGLLGLAVYLNFFGLPRSTPLVGGLVLTLMTLPTIIIASRAALKAVPPWIREAALGVGASKMQMVTDHVLPLALPGMLTGAIIGIAQALGETAPLLMIGMVAFIVDIPQGLTDPATALPVQIYLWADSAERGFVERAAAAILVLLLFMLIMNALAIILRRRFERRW